MSTVGLSTKLWRSRKVIGVPSRVDVIRRFSSMPDMTNIQHSGMLQTKTELAAKPPIKSLGNQRKRRPTYWLIYTTTMMGLTTSVLASLTIFGTALTDADWTTPETVATSLAYTLVGSVILGAILSLIGFAIGCIAAILFHYFIRSWLDSDLPL